MCVGHSFPNFESGDPALIAQISYTLAIGIASAAVYSVLEPIADATRLTLGDLNAGTGYMVREN